MHIKLNGENLFVTPRISRKAAKGGKEDILPNAQMALLVGYVMEAASYTTESDNRLTNKTARNAARDIIGAISGGDEKDLFIYHAPAGVNAAGDDFNGEWTPVITMSRAEVVKACQTLVKADDILGKAESEVDSLRRESVFKSDVKPMPVYGESSVRAKRGGKKVIEF